MVFSLLYFFKDVRYVSPPTGITGFVAQDSTGHFGPFQSCKYTAYYSFCGGSHYYHNTGEEEKETVNIFLFSPKK